MFKLKLSTQEDIRKTHIYKIFANFNYSFLLLIFALSLHVFGKDSAIEAFFLSKQPSIVRYISIALIIIASGLAIVVKMRLKNPVF